MNGISPAEIPILIAKDVERVKQFAAVVIDISHPGITVNPTPGLGVLAVIGPGEFQSKKYEEAVLCEIGLGESRPYHRALMPKSIRRERPIKNENRKRYRREWFILISEYLVNNFGAALKNNGIKHRAIERRREWFSMTDQQYMVASPIIFDMLQIFTDIAVKLRKKGAYSENPFLVPTERNYYSRKHKTVFSSVSYKPALNGARFVVSLVDRNLLNDVFFAELELNDRLQNHLRGLMRFSDLYLDIYKKSFSRSFQNLNRVGFIGRTRSFRKLPKYLKIEMLNRYLPKGNHNPLWKNYVDLFGWNGEPTKERKLANLVLPKPKKRIGDVQLRITTGLSDKKSRDRSGRQKDHIVFEVMPSAGKEAEYVMPNDVSESADECLLAV
ncbi:MAG: hypothetical protein V1845_01100 [bacterium]